MPRSTVLTFLLAALIPGCGDGSGDDAAAGETSSTAGDDPGTGSQADDSPTSAGTASTSGSGDAASSGGSSEAPASDSTSDSTGAPADDSSGEPPTCAKNVVLMGYWPPTNEMLRPWSTNLEQNPDGWQGEDWHGLGYDVYAYFPEFPPDGNPNNDDIGDPGAVGSPDFDLQVDYQATSEDFWRIVDEMQPILLVTTSRGGQIGWEIEAIEGGHGGDLQDAPWQDWSSDGYGPEHFPTEATIEPRSWDAIAEFRVGTTVPSSLPLDAIFDAASALDVATVQIDETGTSGNFLSGFLGLHGVAYHETHAHNLAAGHIHVGNGMPTSTARMLIETTVETVLQAFPAATAACP